MYKVKFVYPFLILVILFSCQTPKQDSSSFEHNILLAENIGLYNEMKLSSTVSQLEYIPLETNKSCLLEDINEIIVINDRIFIAGVEYCYVFSKDGKFLNPIGALGNGPGEYNSVGTVSINKIIQTIFIHTSNKIHEYTWEGNYLRTITVPDIDDSRMKNCFFVKDNIFIGRIINYGDTKYKFCLFNDKGEIIKLFPNTVFFPKTRETFLYDYQYKTNIYQYNNKWCLKESINDTISYLDGTELVPFALFNFGEYRLGGKISKNSGTNVEQLIGFHEIVGFSDFLFFTMHSIHVDLPKNRRIYEIIPSSLSTMNSSAPIRVLDNTIAGIYDFKNKTTVLLENDPACGMFGLINDLDGGLPFWPKYCTDNDELVSIWSIEDIKGVLTEEYFAAHEIKDVQAHQKLKELIKTIKDEDNPVVVIAKLKE